MTNFYDARGLFWSLRPQNMIKFLDPKCREVNLYGEMAGAKFSGIHSPRSRGPLSTGVFFKIADGSLVLKKNSDTKRPGGGGEKNQ